MYGVQNNLISYHLAVFQFGMCCSLQLMAPHHPHSLGSITLYFQNLWLLANSAKEKTMKNSKKGEYAKYSLAVKNELAKCAAQHIIMAT